MRWVYATVGTLICLGGMSPASAGGWDHVHGNVTINVEHTHARLYRDEEHWPVPENLESTLHEIFPTEKVRVKVRAYPKDKKRTKSIKVWVEGKKIFSQNEIDLPNDVLADYVKSALWAHQVSLETRFARLREYLGYISGNTSSENTRRVLAGWRARLVPPVAPHAAGNMYWFLLKKHEAEFQQTLAALHAEAPKLGIDLNAMAAAFNRETGDFTEVLEAANIRTLRLLKQAGFSIFSQNLMALAEAVYDARGTILADVSMEPLVPVTYRTPVGLMRVSVKLTVKLPKESFTVETQFDRSYDDWKAPKYMDGGDWLEPLTEALGESIADSPKALPMIETNRLFQPSCRLLLDDGNAD